MKPLINLDGGPIVSAIQSFHDAKEHLFHSWRHSKFSDMLERNLMSNHPCVLPPSDEWPTLRCYRGSGPHFRLKWGHVYVPEGIAALHIETHYKPHDLDSFSESEGCPGAPVKTVTISVTVPVGLLANPTQKDFNEWAKDTRRKSLQESKREAVRTINELRKKHNIG